MKRPRTIALCTATLLCATAPTPTFAQEVWIGHPTEQAHAQRCGG